MNRTAEANSYFGKKKPMTFTWKWILCLFAFNIFDNDTPTSSWSLCIPPPPLPHLCSFVQLPVRIPNMLWRYLSMPRTWVSSWGRASAVWWSWSCSSERSSSSSRRGKQVKQITALSLIVLSSLSRGVNLSPSHLAARVYWEKHLAIRVNYN